MQKTNQGEFRKEKVIKKKETSNISNGKDKINHLIAGLIKKTYQPYQTYQPFGGDIDAKVDLSNNILLIYQQKLI